MAKQIPKLQYKDGAPIEKVKTNYIKEFNMAQQTAVEWLIEQMFKGNLIPPDTHPNNILFSQAKQMEKEQSKRDYYAGLEGFIVKDGGFEQYYNETYKK